MKFKIYKFKTVTSTNDEAINFIKKRFCEQKSRFGENLEIQAAAVFGVFFLIFIDFEWISGPLFESFLGTLEQNECFCNACFQVTFCCDFGV